jgi:hypothetical protein
MASVMEQLSEHPSLLIGPSVFTDERVELKCSRFLFKRCSVRISAWLPVIQWVSLVSRGQLRDYF